MGGSDRREFLALAGSVGAGFVESLAGGSEDAELVVRIAETNAPVEGGDLLVATGAIENRGERAIQPEAEFRFGDRSEGTRFRLPLEPGERRTFEGTHRTYPGADDTTIPIHLSVTGQSVRRTVDVLGVDDLPVADVDPDRELAVRPGTTVLFEVATETAGTDTHWFLDGKYETNSTDPWQFLYHGRTGRNYLRHAFETGESHEVAVALDPQEGENRRTDWPVEVSPEGSRPPSIDAARPNPDDPLALEDTHTLELDVSGPDGDLDRVVWWLGQADELLGVSDVAGSGDTASLGVESSCATCPVVAWVIDENNLLTSEAVWSFASPRDGDEERTLRVTKEGAAEGIGAFVVSVSGDVDPGDDAEAVASGSTVLDFVGPETGTDRFRFTGDVSTFVLKGEASVFLDGNEVDPSELGSGSTAGASGLPNTLTVTKSGAPTGRCVYGVRVSGSVERTDRSQAVIQGSTALDWVGPVSGTDTLRFSGEITDFLVKGPGVVEVDGDRVDPDSL